jgi:hypothetical protein
VALDKPAPGEYNKKAVFKTAGMPKASNRARARPAEKRAVGTCVFTPFPAGKGVFVFEYLWRSEVKRKCQVKKYYSRKRNT